MSTITDIAPSKRGPAALRFIAVASGVLCVWFAMLAAVMIAFEPETSAIAFGPEAAMFQVLAQSDVRLIANGRGFMRVRAASPGFVKQMYAGGAWLVLPGSAFGCGVPPPVKAP